MFRNDTFSRSVLVVWEWILFLYARKLCQGGFSSQFLSVSVLIAAFEAADVRL